MSLYRNIAPDAGDCGPTVVPGGPARGVSVRVCHHFGMVTVMLRKGSRAALEARLATSFGLSLPHGPRFIRSNGIAIAAIGPEVFAITCNEATVDFARSVRAALGTVAPIVDQSDGHVVFHLAGPDVGAALCKLVAVDLHPDVFGIGHVAVTMGAQMSITLWRVADEEGFPAFEIAVPRSYEESFRAALWESAAEFAIFLS